VAVGGLPRWQVSLLIAEAAREEEKRLAEERARYPVLDLQFYAPETHKAIGKAAHIQSVFAHAPEAPPEEKKDESTAAHFARLGLSSEYRNLLATASHLSGINEKYREQMAHYILNSSPPHRQYYAALVVR
jgi:hypothetical protein